MLTVSSRRIVYLVQVGQRLLHVGQFLGLWCPLGLTGPFLLLSLHHRGAVVQPQAEQAGQGLVDVLVPVPQRLPEVLHHEHHHLPVRHNIQTIEHHHRSMILQLTKVLYHEHHHLLLKDSIQLIE